MKKSLVVLALALALGTGSAAQAQVQDYVMCPGDVPVTYADTTPLERDFGFKPSTPLREGLRKFAEWYKKFYNC